MFEMFQISKVLNHFRVLSAPPSKIRNQGDRAYFSVNNQDEAEAAIQAINGYTMKNRILQARRTNSMPEKKPVTCAFHV